VPVPWTKEAAKAQLAAASSGGAIEPKKDIKAVAQTFVETSTDPAEKYWWSQRVNALSQLETIEITRSLNAEESRLKSEVLKEIGEKSQDVSQIRAALARPHVPATPFPSAADIGAAVAAALPAMASSSSSSSSSSSLASSSLSTTPVVVHATSPAATGSAPGPSAVRLITDNKLGPSSHDSADVQIDFKANIEKLDELLNYKYAKKLTDPPLIHKAMWRDVLHVFGTPDEYYAYTSPLVGKHTFPQFIIAQLEKSPKETRILTSYLLDKGTADDGVKQLNTWAAEHASDPKLLLIAAASKEGRFAEHRNYHVV
jgi:hypothetical protein